MYHSENDRSLSTPAAIGIGIAIGIVCTVLVLVTVLLLHRAWRLRRSPPVKQYRQAKLWKGFEPVTPSTARTTFVGTKMTNIYLTELPTPVTPAFLMSPPLRGEEGYSHIESLRTNFITSLSDRAQQIATFLTTVNGNNKRLLLVAACIYVESCSWLVEILRGLPGFSVANSCRVDEIVSTLFALSASTLDTLLQRLIDGARKVVIEMSTHINKHSASSITAPLQARMCRLDMMISRNLPRRDRRQPPQKKAQTASRAGLAGVPVELFSMILRHLACCYIRSLRQTCNKELVGRCKDSFYNIVNSTAASLQLDADCPARAMSLAKFERWSDHITTLCFKVPRTAFFYQLHQGAAAAAAADGDTFSAMSDTKEFKSALALLITLPRCKAVLIQHDTPSSGWLLCDYQSIRRKVQDNTMAVQGDVLRENLEHGLVGFMLSSHSEWYDEYRLCYFEEREKESEEGGPRAEAEEEGRRTEMEEERRGHEETEDAYAGQSRDMVRDEYRSRGLPRPIPKKKADIVAALQKDDLRRLE
ncbi:hypothetical protein J4E89_008535 [Alternaria sp. Ai002NY15]|nr:hypothetical protein J4E89_008535 [Alternaria sp. Ai002NY15]